MFKETILIFLMLHLASASDIMTQLLSGVFFLIVKSIIDIGKTRELNQEKE